MYLLPNRHPFNWACVEFFLQTNTSGKQKIPRHIPGVWCKKEKQ